MTSASGWGERAKLSFRGLPATWHPNHEQAPRGSDPTGVLGTYRKWCAVCRNDLGGATTVFVEDVRE